MRIGRNQPCPCGSGNKYKKCCGDPLKESAEAFPTPFSRPTPRQINAMLERHKAEELIREQQQGLGRPIVSMKVGDQQIVAAGNTIYSSATWKTMADFLSYYMKTVLDGQWGNAEIQKPFADRHPIMQWYHEYCTYQRDVLGLEKSSEPSVVKSSPMTGVVYCYMGLAYGLYLLKNNVELQARLIKRLKDPKQFQGAYYEVMVANVLIRAGFELTLENEADDTIKHCEFAAVSKKTGKKYSIEAKMRAEAGILGKTKFDGSTDKDATSQLTKHVSEALEKPAHGERMIFVDVNTDPSPLGSVPVWTVQAGRRLDAKEKDLKAGVAAYVFVTNMPFHRVLQSEYIGHCLMGFGLGMPDFGKVGSFRLSEIHRQRIKHADAFAVIQSFNTYPQIPATFNGSLPSTISGKSYDRILIGETYLFNEMTDKDGNSRKDILGTVTSATAVVAEKKIYLCVTDGGGASSILVQPMSDEAVIDYQAHPEAFFGTVQHVGKKIETPYDAFLFFFNTSQRTTKEKLLEFMADSADITRLQQMSQEDLAIEYCERMASHLWMTKQEGQKTTT